MKHPSKEPQASGHHDEWCLSWESPFQTHQYEPLYLANGTFGGMLGLSGATMDLWSSRIGVVPESGAQVAGMLYPITVLRTQVFFQNAEYAEAGVWVGSSGIHCADPRYTSEPSMPHLAQSYGCHQFLDLKAGLATTRGNLALGSQAAVEAGLAPGRVIPFQTRVAFLKDSCIMGLEIVSNPEVQILFSPELILRECLRLGSFGKGIASLGNEISCHLEMSQAILSTHVSETGFTYEMQPSGGEVYHVVITAPRDSEIITFLERPAVVGKGSLFVLIQIVPSGGMRSEQIPETADGFFALQERRWETFWSSSDIRLPTSESLWQQRYRASLFYVAQSMGNSAIHPGGLSKPMLPYWLGCFHDTDTYFCRALLESGHVEEAALHLTFRHRTLPIAQQVARESGRSGALYPWQCDSNGWGAALDVPVNGAIIACEAWHHYLYGRQPSALVAAREILAQTLLNLADHLDLSATPLRFLPKPLMTFSETLEAEDPTEARIALRATAAAYLQAEAAGGECEPPQGKLARRILDELLIPISSDGSYCIGSTGNPVYQRCPSVILGSFPLHCLEADEVLRQTFLKELSRILFLFAWLPHQASVVASQLKYSHGPAGASELLRQADAFYKPWHAFDEWENRRSVRAALFVTASGGFCTAIHHLLVAETSRDLWSLFPGIPHEWRNASFRELRTRAGWKVSAKLVDGVVIEVSAEPVHELAARTFAIEIPNPHACLLSGGVVSENGNVRVVFRSK